MKSDYRAKLIIHDADKLSKKDALEIAKWLKRAAGCIETERGNFEKRYTARLMN